jgi:hypothetical protein
MSNGSTTLGSLNAIVDWRPNDDGISKGNSESQEAMLSAAKDWTSSGIRQRLTLESSGFLITRQLTHSKI